jgi:putative colanic acid biosynthesis glycosyltransferase WcaI
MPLQRTGIGLAGGQSGSITAGKRQRIVVHDFAGHPFQVDLSRHLARRGHDVLHVHCASYTSGKGGVDAADDEVFVGAGDGATHTAGRFRVVGLRAGREFARYSPVRRVTQEVAYGRRFARLAAGFRPDVVVSCNVPLLAHAVAARWCDRHDVPWVFWLQDLYSVAAGAEATNRAGPLGRVLGHGFEAIERSLLRRAAHVVPITDDFLPQLERWGVEAGRCTPVENWAPLDDLPVRPRSNAWRREHGLGDRFTFLYSGTLGLKHRPELLYALARQHVDDADVMVVSEGRGEARLREMLRTQGHLPNLRLVPFQPFDRYPDVLGAADVLVTLLEPTAGTYSVPSKVLSYLCAGRPILAAVPHENLAARTIQQRAGAGLVVDPTDEEAFLVAGKRLRNESQLRATCGWDARAYAEATFDSGRITDRFAEILDGAVGTRPSNPTTAPVPV